MKAAGLSAMKGQPARTAAEPSADPCRLGHAGALAWAFNDPAFPFSPPAIRAFHDQHAWKTAY